MAHRRDKFLDNRAAAIYSAGERHPSAPAQHFFLHWSILSALNRHGGGKRLAQAECPLNT
jgi:hypothetical protein